MAEKKTKRRLKNIRVDEISLVDKGAVQDADFVVLSKRIETVPEETTETTTESEVLRITKAMSEDESFDAANLLHMMAEFTGLVKAMHRTKSRLSSELQSSFDSLKAAMFDGETVAKRDVSTEWKELKKTINAMQEILLKLGQCANVTVSPTDKDSAVIWTTGATTISELQETISKLEKPAQTHTSEYASSDTGGQVVVVKSTLEEAAELLEKRRLDEDESDAQKVLSVLQGIGGQFEKFEADSNGRHEKLDERLNLAMGKG